MILKIVSKTLIKKYWKTKVESNVLVHRWRGQGSTSFQDVDDTSSCTKECSDEFLNTSLQSLS